MAETALRERPAHLLDLEREARFLAERHAGRTLYYPDDDELVAQFYSHLRMRACRDEIEWYGIDRGLKGLAGLLPPPRIRIDGEQWQVEPRRLPEDLPPAAQETWRQLEAWRDSIIERWKDPA